MAKPNLKIELFKDRQGKWRWHIVAKNGKLVAASGENFASKRNAARAVKAFLRGVAGLLDRNGK